LPQVYPDGFKGKQLKDNERENLVALAACVAVKSAARDRSFKNSQTNVNLPQNNSFQVSLNDFKRNISVQSATNNGAKEFHVRSIE